MFLLASAVLDPILLVRQLLFCKILSAGSCSELNGSLSYLSLLAELDRLSLNPPVLFISFVTLGKSVNLFVLQFHIRKMSLSVPISKRLL